jgi:hypothetical protein
MIAILLLDLQTNKCIALPIFSQFTSFNWTEHPGIWYHDLWSTIVRIRVTVRLRISTSPLFVLFTCCWMSFEAVLGNKEFELVNTHGYMTVWYTKGIYVNFVNCFVVILPHHKNLLLLALTLVQYDCYSKSNHIISYTRTPFVCTGRRTTDATNQQTTKWLAYYKCLKSDLLVSDWGY